MLAGVKRNSHGMIDLLAKFASPLQPNTVLSTDYINYAWW